MVRQKLIMVSAFLLLLNGCNSPDQDTFSKISDSSEDQIVSSHVLSQSVSGVPGSSFSEEPVTDSETISPIDPDIAATEHNTTMYNHIGAIIEEVQLVNGSTTEILARNIQPGSSVLAQRVTSGEELSELDDFNNCGSPYFIIVVSGQKIPITVARLADHENEIREELCVTFDEIAFFQTENTYYFSPQPDYSDREKNPGEHIIHAQYLYLPQVQRWLRQREGQLLFAAGLEEEEILAYFPDYTGDIPLTTCAAVISCETIYLEDVRVEIANDDSTVIEIRESDELRTFTPDDVIIIAVDHVRFPDLYFRYQDTQANVRRQYVNDQHRDNNNGTITTHMLTLDDEYYKLVPAD